MYIEQPKGIEEVVALERAISAALPKLKGGLLAEARSILRGRPETGTRLDALRDIARRCNIS
jgi:hypothetical protein